MTDNSLEVELAGRETIIEYLRAEAVELRECLRKAILHLPADTNPMLFSRLNTALQRNNLNG